MVRCGARGFPCMPRALLSRPSFIDYFADCAPVTIRPHADADEPLIWINGIAARMLAPRE
jgi:hypothetical protein